VNGVKVCDEHDGSLSVNENEIVLAKQGIGFEFFGESFKELLLSRAEKVFQRNHADISSA